MRKLFIFLFLAFAYLLPAQHITTGVIASGVEGDLGPIQLTIDYTATQFNFKWKAPSSSTLTFHWGDGTTDEVAGQDGTLVTTTSSYSGAGEYSFYVSGDYADLTYLDIQNQTFVSGDVARFSELTNLVHLYFRQTGVSGDISGYAAITPLQRLYAYETDVSGDVSGYSALTSMDILFLQQTDVTFDNITTWSLDGANIRMDQCAWTVTDVNNALTSWAAGPTQNSTLNIGGNNAARSSETDNDLDTLTTYSNTVTVNEPEYTLLFLGDKTGGYLKGRSDYVDDAALEINADYIIGAGDYATEDNDSDTLTYAGAMYKWSDAGLIDSIYTPVGNHDIQGDTTVEDFLTFFSYDSSYYAKRIGDVEFFFYDVHKKFDNSGWRTILETWQETDTADYQNSTQGQWILDTIANSTADFKVIVFHNPPISSATNGYKAPGMSWDWAYYGIDLILTGHFHWYERLIYSGPSGDVPLITNGLGGAGPLTYKTPVAESQVIKSYDVDYDFVRGCYVVINVTSNTIDINLHAVSADGTVVRDKDALIISY